MSLATKLPITEIIEPLENCKIEDLAVAVNYLVTQKQNEIMEFSWDLTQEDREPTVDEQAIWEIANNFLGKLEDAVDDLKLLKELRPDLFIDSKI